MNRRLRALVTGLVAGVAVPALVLGASPAWSADPISPPTLPDAVTEEVTAPEPMGVAEGLKSATGTVEVTVRLAEPAIAESVTEGAIAEGALPGKAAQKAKKDKVEAQQDGFLKQSRGLGAKELGRTVLAANLVAVSVDAAQLEELASLDNVISVTPIRSYETHASTQTDDTESGSLSQAIDYVKARSLHDAGIDGTGVKVAVLDSGIDFTHVNLGGPGEQSVTDECFAAPVVAPAGVCADLFGEDAPKVKGGYDFVGETWPNGARTEDPNPIDAGSAAGHGTHVADIIGGRSADGTHEGIAPGVSLYAVKVCSAVSTACNGVAMLKGMDWSLDPNGDDDISDAVDVVNMSLGSSYGQEQDDSAFAADNLVHAGVVVVASAGNSADRPFIVGSPSSAPGVISVAQTALPDDLKWVIEPNTGLTITNSVLQSWSPAPTAAITGGLARPAGTFGCTAADFSGFPAGSVALIQRGTCAASEKSVNAQNAGAIAVIIYNNAPGDPPSFSFGSAVPVTVPTFTISQADGLTLIASGATSVTIDPASAVSLVNTMVGTSSRGTTMGDHRAKPDIGAPGAWLSAETGTATEETNFGGTSGAAPVVSGAAALLIDKYPTATPTTIKARLLNGADNANRTPTADGFITTPISRIGAGEVRVAPSADAVSVLSTVGGNIGLGIPAVTSTYTAELELSLTNTSNASRKYSLAASYRDPADQASGAVVVKATPVNVTVPKGKTQKVKLQVTIDGAKLQAWKFDNVGRTGGDGSLLNDPEFDGWITATSGGEKVKVGWTALPKKAADVSAPESLTLDGSGAGSLALTNASAVTTGPVDVFSLTGTSPRLEPSVPDGPGTPGSNAVVIDLAAAGVRDAGTAVQFAVATYDRRTVLPYPAEFDVYVDSDNDGTDDYVVYNGENGTFASTGQTLVYVVNLRTNAGGAYYYDIGGFDSSTQVLTAPWAALGIVPGQTFGYSVYAFDNYFTGDLVDAIEGQTYTAGQPKYTPTGSTSVAPGSTTSVAVQATGSTAPSSETGLLLLYGSAATNDFGVVQIPQ
jgi:minor extracellular serine protease Vpr